MREGGYGLLRVRFLQKYPKQVTGLEEFASQRKQERAKNLQIEELRNPQVLCID
jgi:hypothetical protein